jgi:hypothetical protein
MFKFRPLPILVGAAALGAFMAATSAHASLMADGITYTLFETTTANPLVDDFDLHITGINCTVSTAGCSGKADTEGGRSGVESIAFGTSAINFSSATAPPGFTEMAGGLNDKGCDGSGASFFCFKVNTIPAFSPALTADSTLDFDFSVTLSSGNFSGFTDSFKISWTGSQSSIKNNGFHSGYDNVSLPLAATVPAPPLGHGLPVALAVGGLLLGFKLWERGQKRRSLGTAIPHAAA